MLLHDRKISAHQRFALQNGKNFFRLTGGRGSCRAVISADRQIGRSADGQFGGLTVGIVGALSPTVVKLQNCRRPQGATLQKFWRFQTSAHWRARLLPSRNFGRSAIRQIGKSADGQFGGLTVGIVGALSPTVVKLQNNRHPQGATLQKFWQFQTSVHWRARLLPSRDFGSSANRQVGRSGCRQVGRWTIGRS